jgi:hypothetical protein
MLLIVITNPAKLTGVSLSWKMMPAALIVTTSLNMPQILNVTTEERFRSANSEEIMQNASTPGNIKRKEPNKSPCTLASAWYPL